ncbi:unnamed protein product [Cylindrotheca closterium]|uniref:Enoyl reductase (ER) domain-containing protein n=1 Tax=Cylindrotheca closterium TaxID=2856 RepID=A0AAD2FV14_9STRA|nr:unnamed protein product [Cylindrotheca closterium]
MLGLSAESIMDQASTKDQPQSPWDVMWEYILDDFESDDDDDNTVPTVSTRGTIETAEENVMSMTLLKDQWMKAAKEISDFAQTHVIEERDESGSSIYPWRRHQRKLDVREKNESRKVKWSGFGIKSKMAKKQDQQLTAESILDKASMAAVAISTGVKKVKWEEVGGHMINIFDVVQPRHVLSGGQSSSDSSCGDSESKGYSVNSAEDDSISHHDARVDKSAKRASGRHHHRDGYDDPESFLNGSKSMENCFKKPAVRQVEHKTTTQDTNHPKSGTSVVRIPISSPLEEDAGHGKDSSGTGRKDGDDGPSQLTRKFACFAKIENNELDAIHQLDDDMGFFFPAARMVSDLEGQVPISLQMSAENGVMGIPSDHFLGTKGPQSLYSYEYEGRVHMDISYTKFGDDPHECIALRKFEFMPTLKPEDGNRVLLQVEASTISIRDCKIRQGKLKIEEYGSSPVTPGVDVVGKVIGVSQSTSSSFALYPGQSVLSLVQVGGNSRYISVDPERLVKVSEGMDPAQVVCLCDTYLSAFQSLHYGQIAFSRYAAKSLEGKTVLIIGSIASTFGKAVMELAVDGNAAIVFATAKRKYWRMLLGLGIIPLPDDSTEWLNRVEGTVDLALIVGMEEPSRVAAFHERALRENGRLIICGCDEPKKFAKSSERRVVVYDVYDQWGKNLEVSKRDMQHLIALLEKEKIRPKVLDRLPLAKVADAQKLIESKAKLSGILVCEPWMKTKKRALYL